MKKWILGAAAGGAWLSALGSAAALTVVLGRPAVPYESMSTSLPRHGTEVVEVASDGLAIPVTTIVSRTVRVAASSHERVVPAVQPRDISGMNCEGWRELQMGSGMVQICQ
jgi:hypothetical protein